MILTAGQILILPTITQLARSTAASMEWVVVRTYGKLSRRLQSEREKKKKKSYQPGHVVRLPMLGKGKDKTLLIYSQFASETGSTRARHTRSAPQRPPKTLIATRSEAWARTVARCGGT